MVKKTIDRRIQRTRALLRDALVSLFLRMDYETITIKDIVDEANVARSTFYAHYASKEELLRSGFEALRVQLIDQQKEALAKRADLEDRSMAFSLPMFEHAAGHIDLYRALIGGRGGAVAVDSIRRILSDLVRDELTATLKRTSADGVPHEMVVQFVVGAFMAVLTWWLDRKAKIPPEKIDAMFRQIVIQGITSPSLA